MTNNPKTTSSKFKDVFISYGRRESLSFVGKLHQQLKLNGFEVWFDKVNIPDGENYTLRINHGIESAHNFIYVMAPRSLSSPYCLIELEYARVLGKRVIPINQMVIQHTEPKPLSTEEKAALEHFYWSHRLPNPNLQTSQDVLSRSLYLIGNTDWLDAKEELNDADCQALANWAKGYENHWHKHESTEYLKGIQLPTFGKSIDSLEDVVERVTTVLERESNYINKHTLLLNQALYWTNNQKVTKNLLVGEERIAAEEWLLQPFTGDRQIPCQPSDLQCEFICESRKNAENLMTDVFICSSKHDIVQQNEVVKTLARYGVTTWKHDKDIRKGEDYQAAIFRGIEEADNFLFFVSPNAVKSEHCQREYQYAIKLNKRVIPLLIAPIDTHLEDFQLLEGLATMYYIDFTDNQKAADFERDIDEILTILKQEQQYHLEHKQLLTKAIKWKKQHKNPVFLLRGFNLENAQTWFRINGDRQQYAPIQLHEEYIKASAAAKGTLSTEVFISYSRKDSDFARKLNNALQEAGKTTWFDQESIASGADFQAEIYKGIQASDNVLFIISPDAINSIYCQDEVSYASEQHKRFVSVLFRTPESALPEELGKINWLDFEKGDFDLLFKELIQTLEIDRAYVHQHTILQQRTIEWEESNKNADFLLNASASVNASQWLKDANGKTPLPTGLQKDFIKASEEAIVLAKQKEAIISQRLKQRLQLARAGFVVAVLLLCIAGYFIWESNENLTKAEQAQLRAEEEKIKLAIAFKKSKANEVIAQVQAQNLIEKDPTLSFNLINWADNVFKGASPIISKLQNEVYRNKVFYKSFKRWKGWQHTRSITSIAFSPDGTRILTGSYDNTVKLWDLEGNELQVFKGHSNHVFSVAFSPDGTHVLTGSNDNTAKLWDLEGNELQAFKGNSYGVSSVAFSPNGMFILTGSGDNTAKLWDLEGNELQYFKGHSEDVSSVIFSPDGTHVLTGSNDNTAKLWNLEGNELQVFKGHSDWVSSVAFSPDGTRILTGSRDNTAKLWDLRGNELQCFKGHSDDVTSTAFSPDGKYILTGSRDNTAKLWDLDGNELKVLKGHSSYVTSVTFSPNGMRILTGSTDGSSKLWNLRGNELKVFNKGHSKEVDSAVFSPDGTYILTGSLDGTAKLWDLSGNELKTFKGHSGPVFSAVFSPDGKYILTGSGDNTAKLWDLEGNELQCFKGHSGAVSSVTFSPDGTLVLTGNGDNTAKLWDLSGNELETFEGHTDWVFSVAFSPDGTRILTGSGDNTAKLWDLDGNELKLLKGHSSYVTSVTFSPNGMNILTGSWDNTAKLWDLEGNELKTFKGHSSYVTSIAFSPDGMRVLTGNDDDTARLWDLDGNELKVFKGHSYRVSSVAFSPNGMHVLTGSWDRTAKLWDLGSSELKSFKGHSDDVTSTAFSPDGKYILTGSRDNTAKLWDLEGNELQCFKGHSDDVTSVAFSRDGTRFLTVSWDNTAKLWDLSGNNLQDFTGFFSVAFSPDGTQILTGNRDNTVKLWDLSGNSLQSFNGHSEMVSSVAFSPKGRYILTGSSDRTAKLWDLDGNELKSFNGHSDYVTSIAFSPDGTLVLTGSLDETAKLWDLEGNELQSFNGHSGAVSSVTFSPDGKYILTGSGDNTAKTWDLSGNELETFKVYYRAVNSVAFSPGGTHILTGNSDHTAKLWNVKMSLKEYIKNGNYDRLTESQKREWGLLEEY